MSAGLQAGRFDPGMMAGGSYLPGQVEFGDKVTIDFERRGGASICYAIMICKRPGGRVPPSPNLQGDEHNVKMLGYKYHEYANAQQDLEEKGIPLPDKFKPKPSPKVPDLPDLPDLPGSIPVLPIVPAIPPARP